MQPWQTLEVWRQNGLAAAALGLVFAAWEEADRHWPLACRAGCAVCCTNHLAITTLEGRVLARSLEESGQSELLTRAVSQPSTFSPVATFNDLARLCLALEAPPAEKPHLTDPAPCPLLQDGLCVAYGARPLGCRVMVSRQACPHRGSALAEPWWLTLAIALHQIVEHLDRGGLYGPLASVLAANVGGAGEGLLPCRPLPGIPAPTEHQARLQGVLECLFRQPLQGRPLGWWLVALDRA